MGCFFGVSLDCIVLRSSLGCGMIINTRCNELLTEYEDGAVRHGF